MWASDRPGRRATFSTKSDQAAMPAAKKGVTEVGDSEDEL